MNATTTRTRTARKVIGSLGIVGAAAAVAGLGTFGTFTDSTAPLNASVNTGTVSIDLTPANDTGSLALNAGGFVPGDSISRSVDLANNGTAPFGSIGLNTVSTGAANALTTNTTHGLKLSVQSCSVAWTKTTAANGAAQYACTGGTTKTLVTSMPAVGNFGLPTPASLATGGVDHLVVTLALPTSAGDDFQGLSSALSLTFTGVQANGTAR